MIITDSVKRRFYNKVDVNMQWIGYKNNHGYGKIYVNDKKEFAHRISYTMHIGEIPKGMCVLHSCDDPGCVLPEHLHLGTHKDNAREMVERGRAKNGGHKGERVGTAKLTERQVLEIRERYKQGQTQCNLATEYGVRQCTVSAIVIRKLWGHI